MLTSHPRICVPPECGWVIGKLSIYGECCGDINYHSFVEDFFDVSTRKVETWKLSREEILGRLHQKQPQTYPELVDVMYRLYIDKHQPGKELWGDKNNFYVRHLDELVGVFPKAKYISIFRDGRDVAVSYMDMKQYVGKRYAPRAIADPAETFRLWADTQIDIEEKLPEERRLLVQYEALVQRPETELTRVCSFLGEEYSPEMLLYYERNYEPLETMAWKQRTRRPPTASRVRRWKTRFSAEDVEAVNNIIEARPYLLRYLYKDEE
jgi:hypothetical protein